MVRGGPVDIDGDEPLGYGDAVGAVAELADLEALEQQLGQDYPGATLDDIDVDALERQLPGPRRRRPRDVAPAGGRARAPGIPPPRRRRSRRSRPRRCGDSVRAHCAGSSPSSTHQARGDHDDQRSGAADERTGAFLPWRFGDERPIDAVRTVQNAVLRRAEHAYDPERLSETT